MQEMKVLDINPTIAGISGDMLVAALFAIEDRSKEIEKMFSNSKLPIKIELKTKTDGIYSGVELVLEGMNVSYDSKSLKEILFELAQLHLDVKYQDITKEALSILYNAEEEVHGDKDLHLHELGTLDTVFDIFATAYMLQKLEINFVNYSPIATGQGTIKTAHGILGVPAPATTKIIDKYKLVTVQGPIGEAATPTGVAILASMLKHLSMKSNIIWEAEGIGFGTKSWQDRSNVLRARIGTGGESDTNITILETNLDDITGEAIGSAFDLLLNNGALDVTLIPILMKKNRPGYILRVMCKYSESNHFAELIMRSTGSLGVRVQAIERHVAQRNVETIQILSKELGKEVEIRVKKGIRWKIEFDDIQKLADQHDRTFLEMEQILYRELYRQ